MSLLRTVVFWFLVTGVRSTILNCFKHLESKTSPEDQTLAVQKLIARLFASRSNEFNLLVKPGNGVLDTFQYVSDADGRINVQANTGVALAAGVYHFLKYHCNIHVSWSGDQLNLPNPLPRVSQLVKINFQERFRYYQNVCTYSYSFAFWDWTRWEREIDWMALSGINFPLAFSGQEGIWQIVYKELGLTQEELDQHFAGPAFLAWQRMGNLDKWGGPLPVGWYENQLELQKKILNRMRSFGMIPVLPGFAGHVPKALIDRLYPNANYTRNGPWNGFVGEYQTVLLNPTDTLFRTVGQKFIEKQIEVYNGTDHVYNGDVFNEMPPPEYSESYMHSASKNIFQAMQAGDADATWLLQGWTFLQAFWNERLIKAWLSAVPYGKLIVLDLASELRPVYNRTNAYFGHPFIWNMIENFGGNTRLYGKISYTMEALLETRKIYPGQLIGSGITSEGLGTNEITFDLMIAMMWREEKIDPIEFTIQYIRRRYGQQINLQMLYSWNILIKTVYDAPANFINKGGALGRVPVTRPYLTRNLTTAMWYERFDLVEAWKSMVSAVQTMKMSDTLRHDLVKLGAQMLEDISIDSYNLLIDSFLNQSLSDVEKNGARLLDILSDMDLLLSSNSYTLLGSWLESAKLLSNIEVEKRNLEYNARNQLTLWGPDGQIHDYANKNWAGLVGSYYSNRWNMFIEELKNSLKTGHPYNETSFHANLLKFEKAWNFDNATFPVKPIGDALNISKYLFKKYT